MKKIVGAALALAVLVVAAFAWIQVTKSQRQAEESAIQRGRYLVSIAGCNDCHTAGYADQAGAVDEADWLTGDGLGWQGPWGTTYSINLRLYMQQITETQWLQIVPQLKSRPPMPYFNLQDMTVEDLRAIYRYIRSLGAAGVPAPPYLPLGVEPVTPVFRFVAPGE